MSVLTENTLAFLAERGCADAVEGSRVADDELLARCFLEAYPSGSGWSASAREYLSALSECLCCMNEQLYVCYRVMCDLYRRFISEYQALVPREDPVWQDAVRRGDGLSLADPAILFRHPHKN